MIDDILFNFHISNHGDISLFIILTSVINVLCSAFGRCWLPLELYKWEFITIQTLWFWLGHQGINGQRSIPQGDNPLSFDIRVHPGIIYHAIGAWCIVRYAFGLRLLMKLRKLLKTYQAIEFLNHVSQVRWHVIMWATSWYFGVNHITQYFINPSDWTIGQSVYATLAYQWPL